MYGLKPGITIGPYTLEHSLGEGGQGSVWQVHSAQPRAPGSAALALKVIPIRGSSAVTVERFRREAEALIRLSSRHPSVVSCHGLCEDDSLGVLAVVMDKVEGVDLQEALNDPRCDQKARESILLHIARALAYLHESGFVHRDIKPQNILIEYNFFHNPNDPATVKLVDFGIAIPTGNPKPLTQVGTVIGTPAYMSPERIDPMFWRAVPGLPSEDIFAFGVVAYEAFFGTHPAHVVDDGTLSSYAERYRAIENNHEPWPPLPPSAHWIDALRGALALRSAHRFPNGAAMVAAITTFERTLTDPVLQAQPRTVAQGSDKAAFTLAAVTPIPSPSGARTEVAAFPPALGWGSAPAGNQVQQPGLMATPPPAYTPAPLVPAIGYPAAPSMESRGQRRGSGPMLGLFLGFFVLAGIGVAFAAMIIPRTTDTSPAQPPGASVTILNPATSSQEDGGFGIEPVIPPLVEPLSPQHHLHPSAQPPKHAGSAPSSTEGFPPIWPFPSATPPSTVTSPPPVTTTPPPPVIIGRPAPTPTTPAAGPPPATPPANPPPVIIGRPASTPTTPAAGPPPATPPANPPPRIGLPASHDGAAGGGGVVRIHRTP